MSATEIIQQIKTMPLQERRAVFQFLTEDLRKETSLYDEFTALGKDADASDVSYAAAAQAEVVLAKELDAGEFGKHSTFNAEHSTPNPDTDVRYAAAAQAEVVPAKDPDAGEFWKHSTLNAEHSTPNPDTDANWTLREGDAGTRKFDLENRLLEFASAVIDLTEKLPSTRAGNHVAGQLLRSGTSPYPNHAEAEAAESREDFIQKLKISLKELRETRRWARLVQRKGWARNEPTLLFVLKQCDELIRIFFCSVKTARQNSLAEKRRLENSARYPSAQSG